MFRPINWTTNRKFFKTLVEGSSLLGWICDADGYCIYLSPAWYAHTGAFDAEGLNWLNYIHPDDRVTTRRTFLDAVDRASEYASEFRLLTADGRYAVASGHGVPNHDAEGQYLGLMGLVRTVEQIAEETQIAQLQTREQNTKPLLTAREREVLQLFAEGYTAEAAASRLGISPFTVTAHANKAVTKLGAMNRTHAVIKAIKLNELVLDEN